MQEFEPILPNSVSNLSIILLTMVSGTCLSQCWHFHVYWHVSCWHGVAGCWHEGHKMLEKWVPHSVGSSHLNKNSVWVLLFCSKIKSCIKLKSCVNVGFLWHDYTNLSKNSMTHYLLLSVDQDTGPGPALCLVTAASAVHVSHNKIITRSQPFHHLVEDTPWINTITSFNFLQNVWI